MRKSFTPLALLFLFCFHVTGMQVLGQQPVARVTNALNAGARNYTTFTRPNDLSRKEATEHNPGYENHPEVGELFAGAPCDNCYELIGKRTEQSKLFVKNGSNGREVMQQTSSGAMHYRGPDGEWLTIKSQLKPMESSRGTFAALEQETPVVISPANKFSALGKDGRQLRFNNKLELIYAQFDGPEVSMGVADYSHYTAGDDGVYVTDAWPGIDIEMFVVRGAIKTNFIINRAMPGIYSLGHLLIRDHLEMAQGWSLHQENGNEYNGNLEVRNAAGETMYAISQATVFEKAAAARTMQVLKYRIDGRQLDIEVPGTLVNKAADAYPVVIDPLITVYTGSSVNGSTYSPAWTTGCVYTNPATVPAMVTVTDVQFTFQYVTGGGAVLNNGAYDFRLGTCRSPSVSTLFWNCNSLLTGSCDAVLATIFPQVAPCMPPPQCTSYNLNITMDFYQDYASTTACNPTYIMAGTPLTITITGHTVESGPITATSAAVCQGQSAVLTAASVYGVGPYTYMWYPGGIAGASDTVSPASSATYTVVATDACGNTSAATKTITVNPLPVIGGVTTVCAGGTSALSSSITGGAWASANTAIATIGSASGVLSGVALGTTTVTYTTPAGCTATAPVTVKAAVAPITGFLAVCQGSTSSLSDPTPAGTWTSGNTAIALVGSATGFASGISSGTANITYSTYGGGCYATATLTVNPLAPISGTSSMCVGGSTTLSDAVPGGTWSSSSPLVTVGSTSGIVNGLAVGSANITYLTPAGCVAISSVVVNYLNPITGAASVCQGSTTNLSDAAPGGNWVSGSTSVATIGSTSGAVIGVSAGTSLISYSIPGGCFTTRIVTVNPISPISGTPGVCIGGSTTLIDAAGPGTWSSSNTSVATIGSASGMLTGVTVGAATITYVSAAGCSATSPVSITLPTPVTGITNVCQGGATTLGNSTAGGTWTSSNPAVATAGATTGIISGLSAGVATITYTTPAGCAVTTSFTVNGSPSISGTALLCVGAATTLGSSIAGGTWTCGATGIATVNPSGGVVNGVSAGLAGITYTTAAGCVATTTVTVNAPSPISGTPNVCQGSSVTLSDAVPGGAWTSSNMAIASVGAMTGVVTGLTGGVVTINYITAGGCNAVASFTVNPISIVTGPASVCAGGSIALSDATPGGTWGSGNLLLATVGASTGIVTGVSAGTVAINYTTAAGCIASSLVAVSAAPSPIVGSTLVCATSALSDAVAGGLWTSSDPTTAVVGITSGLVSGINPGMVTITYTLPGGCFTTATLTVDPVTPVTGVPNVCQGSTTALSYPQPGGIWSSLNPAVATVDGAGTVTGISAGTATIKYTTATGCNATVNITVYPINPITGTTSVCQGSTTVLTDGTPGGSWASSNPAVAAIGVSTGVVTGSSPGTSIISYTTGAGCSATATVTVSAVAPITGPPAICAGSTATLADAIPGGAWSSVNPAVAAIDPVSGAVSGLSAGTTLINYTTAAGCLSARSFTVNALPSGIVGGPMACQGQTILLTDALPGGSWTSSVPAVATIGAGSGIVTGLGAGTTIISYTTGAGCFAFMNLTVNPLQSITGTGAICVGDATVLSNATPGGGLWSSVSPGIASIDPVTGVVSGVSAGVATIKFTTAAGCVTNFNETINALPSVPVVIGGGVAKVCVGSSITLTDALPGGAWSISNPAVATIGLASGVVTGLSADTATVTYTSSAGCVNTIVITVNPLPAAITGTTSICAGATTALSDATAGGAWSAVLPAIASIGIVSGIVTGISSGVTTIKYTTPQGCSTSAPFTVNAMPGAISGVAVVCQGATITLSNSLPGGTWTSSAPSVAAIGAGSGILSGVAAGIATITYGTPAGCYVVKPATVNPAPVIGSVSHTNPTTCITHDGTITLSGLVPGATYTVNYYSGSVPVTIVLTADGSGRVTVTGLAATIYTNFKATTTLGCTSNLVPGPIVLSLPAAPPAPVAGNNTPICDGVTLNLTATDATPGVTYSWSGPGGFSSSVQNPVLSPSSMTEAGTYTVTATVLGCVSAPAATTVVIHPIPHISKLAYTNPATCLGTDGTITLSGLLAGVNYNISYTANGSPVTAALVADAAGTVTVTGLPAGTYGGFNVSSFTCRSDTVGPVTLADPNPPPVPQLFSNSPICAGKTLALDAADAITGLTYEWAGPNGFTSGLRNPEVPNVSMADSGLYTLTIKYLNCPAAASENVIVYPPVVLTDVTKSQPIPYGSYIKLNAAGAEFYLWSPNDGTLNNPNVYNPVATPLQSTVYIVEGVNKWGCVDSATVAISVDDNINEGVPGAFTPNGDGLNDEFKVANVKYDKLVDFSVYNRWGQLVYHNTYDVNQGWDGKFNGVPQEMGTYNYRIILSDPNGKEKYFKGAVILIR